MINQLVEKYLDTISTSGWKAGHYEVFTNPSRRDIMDAIGNSKGYRFIIDWDKKLVYVFSSDTFHQAIMDAIPALPDFDPFWDNKKFTDRIFTGDIYGFNINVNSDALYAGVYRRDQINTMLDRDWKWVERYLPVDKIKNMLEEY